jgi:hypothetical protein
MFESQKKLILKNVQILKMFRSKKVQISKNLKFQKMIQNFQKIFLNRLKNRRQTGKKIVK